MSIAVRINESLYKDAKKAAKAEFRSIAHQIEFWSKIGKCALDNPDLPIEFIKDVLIAKEEEMEPFEFEKRKEIA